MNLRSCDELPPRLVMVNGFGAPNTMLKHWPACFLSCDDLKSDPNVSWHFANQMEDHANINFCFFIVDLYPCSSENATCLWIDRQPWLLWRLCVNIDVMFCSLTCNCKACLWKRLDSSRCLLLTLMAENDWTWVPSMSVLLAVGWCLCHHDFERTVKYLFLFCHHYFEHLQPRPCRWFFVNVGFACCRMMSLSSWFWTYG